MPTNKPWGYEYLIHESNVGVWVLHIDKNKRTSFHCHPEKETRLLVIKGQVQISSLDGSSKILGVGQKVRIGKREFHRTKALYDSVIIEVEYPNKKTDIVRLSDDYGRFTMEDDDGEIKNLDISGVKATEYQGYLNGVPDGDYIFLSGGIMHNDKFLVAPGDVLSSHEINKLSAFKKLKSTCLVVTYG